MFRKLIRTRAHLSLILANSIYGINYAVAKVVMPDQIKPLALVSLRSFVAAILFWITGLFLPREKVRTRDLIYIFGCSFFGVVINQIFFLTGLNLTSPINASILVSTNPIYAFVFAALILKEKITFLKGSGLALGLTGVLILILHNGTPDVGSATFIGDVIILINTISWALYTVIIKKMLEKYHPVTVMKWLFLFGSFTNIPAGYKEWISMDWSFLTIKAYLEIGFVVIFATYLGYLFMSFGLRRLSPTIVSTYTYTQPVVAAYLASIMGQDHVNLVMVISALLIFLGVYVVSIQNNAGIPRVVTRT